MANISILPGDYNRFGNTLRNKETQLLIFDRKNTTPKKPRYFIILLDPNGLKKYISSLYPINEPAGIFKFDYLARVYHLHLHDETATILEIPRQNTKSDIIVSLSDSDTLRIIKGERLEGVK